MGESGGRLVVRAAAKALQRGTVVGSEAALSWTVEMVWWYVDSDHEWSLGCHRKLDLILTNCCEETQGGLKQMPGLCY